MRHKRLLSTLIFLGIIASLTVFYAAPKYQFIPKLLFMGVLIALGVWHYIHKNLMPSLAYAGGTLLIGLTLPNSRVLKDIEVIGLLMAWGAAAYFIRRAKAADLDSDR